MVGSGSLGSQITAFTNTFQEILTLAHNLLKPEETQESNKAEVPTNLLVFQAAEWGNLSPEAFNWTEQEALSMAPLP